MKKFEGFLLVSDIDGTLAEQRYINPANITAVNRFVADGGQVLLATGRSPQSSVPVAKKLGCSAKVIANNGAVVYDAKSDGIVLQHTLDCMQISLDILQNFDVGGMLYCGEDLWLIKDNFEMTRLIKSEKLIVKEHCDNPINKVLFGGKPAVIDEVEAAVKGELAARFEEMKEVIIEENRAPADPKVNMLKISLEEINQKIQNYMSHLGSTSEIVSSMIEAEIEKLVGEKIKIETEIEDYNRKNTAKIAYSEIIPLLNEFDDMPVESKRVIASQFINRVLLWEDRMEIEWKF